MDSSQTSSEQMRDALKYFIEPKLIHPEYIAETLTFRSNGGRSIGKAAAIDAFAEHIKRIQKKTLGRKYSKNGQRLQVVPILEGGEGHFDKHLHIHSLMQVPDTYSPADFVELAARGWRTLGLASRHQNRHEICTDVNGWLDYLLKTSDKPSYADSLIADCLHL